MSLATARIDCMVSPPLLGAMEDCSIVRCPQLQRLCRQNCCMSGQRRMFGSLWNKPTINHNRLLILSRALTVFWWRIAAACTRVKVIVIVIVNLHGALAWRHCYYRTMIFICSSLWYHCYATLPNNGLTNVVRQHERKKLMFVYPTRHLHVW